MEKEGPVDREVYQLVVDLLEQKLQGALQLVAALVLKDGEEMEDEMKGHDAAWRKSIKRDLSRGSFRVDLLSMLRKENWMTNTHVGFALAPFETSPADMQQLASVAEAFKVALAEASVDQLRGRGQEEWHKYLVAEGHPVEVVEYLLTNTDAHGWASRAAVLTWRADATPVE